MAGRFKGFCHFPCFQTLPPSRAPQARGEACVTVFERRSHLGPPAEGRPGPSILKRGQEWDVLQFCLVLLWLMADEPHCERGAEAGLDVLQMAGVE